MVSLHPTSAKSGVPSFAILTTAFSSRALLLPPSQSGASKHYISPAAAGRVMHQAVFSFHSKRTVPFILIAVGDMMCEWLCVRALPWCALSHFLLAIALSTSIVFICFGDIVLSLCKRLVHIYSFSSQAR